MAINPDMFDAIADRVPGSRDPIAIRKRVETVEALLEGIATIPGTNQRVGLDFIIGLVPVIGDLVTTAMGAWLIWEARNLGMSRFQILRMAGNVAFDAALGLIPFAGDALDFFYRSNSRNLRMIKRHLDKHHPATAVVEAPVIRR